MSKKKQTIVSKMLGYKIYQENERTVKKEQKEMTQAALCNNLINGKESIVGERVPGSSRPRY